MGSQRAVTALTADARMRVWLEGLGHVRVAFHARQPPGIDDRMGLVLRQGAGPVRADYAVILRHQHPAETGEQRDANGKQRRQSKQVLVRGELRHALRCRQGRYRIATPTTRAFFSITTVRPGNYSRRRADLRIRRAPHWHPARARAPPPVASALPTRVKQLVPRTDAKRTCPSWPPGRGPARAQRD